MTAREIAMGHINGGPHNKGKGAAIAFLRGLVDHQGGDCITWPFFRLRNGYGRLGHLGGHYYAHALLCEMVHGPAPELRHEVAHSCGKGHEGCVNPNHLSWKTRSGNMADRHKHGTFKRKKKWTNVSSITAADVQEICALRGQETQYVLADKFKISPQHVGRIQLGWRPKHLFGSTPGQPVSTDEAQNDPKC